jgi:hypothetical protein
VISTAFSRTTKKYDCGLRQFPFRILHDLMAAAGHGHDKMTTDCRTKSKLVMGCQLRTASARKGVVQRLEELGPKDADIQMD